MSGGGLSGVGTAVNAAQRLRRSDAATSAATELMESAQQMGVLNVELMARDLARIADADPQRADDLMAELKPQLSAADQETLAQELAAAGVKTVTSKVGKNEVTWKLDGEGYPVRAEGDLREVFSNATRSASETKAQGEAADRGQAGDVGGHIVGHRFVLDQGDKNLFPQNGQFNNSAYKKLENEWADWIDTGKKEVHVEIEFFGGSAARPDKMEVFYKVVDPATGKTVSKKTVDFDNEAGQVFDRTPKKDMQ